MRQDAGETAHAISSRGTIAEVLAAFLWLGLRGFGGPVAHLGYFHEEFFVRRLCGALANSARSPLVSSVRRPMVAI